MEKQKPQAVLDTSFWSSAVRTGADAYLPLFFRRPLLVPRAVVDEVERGGQPVTRRLREDQQRFRLWMEDGRLEVRDAGRRYPRFGAGEAAVLALALESPDLRVLVNEAGGYREGERLGLQVVSVPEIVVRLAWSGRIAPRSAAAMLDVLSDVTSEAFIEAARRAVARGGRQR